MTSSVFCIPLYRSPLSHLRCRHYLGEILSKCGANIAAFSYVRRAFVCLPSVREAVGKPNGDEFASQSSRWHASRVTEGERVQLK